MWYIIWPIGLTVLSNTIYQICARCVPASVNPLASLTVSYAIAAVFSGVLYYAIYRNGNLMLEYSKMNWSSIVLGLVIVGLEVGFIYAFQHGWEVSTAAIVQSSFLGVALIFVGYFLFHEALTWNKILGIVICLIGLAFINK